MTGRSAPIGPRRSWRPAILDNAEFVDRAREIGPLLLVVGLAVAVLAGLAVLPARTWITQRENMVEVQAELEQIEAEVAGLEAELELLQTDEEIERLAREHFDLVYPGDESYRILPAED